MRSLCRVLVVGLAVIVATGAVVEVVPPSKGNPSYATRKGLVAPQTDISSIVSVVRNVNQKGGAAPDDLPNQEVAETIVTAVDGRVTESGPSSSEKSSELKTPAIRRALEDYRVLFWGTGVQSEDRDASVEGTAYLTHTLVPNTTYNVEACLDYCSSVEGCVFANLYYEFNNYWLDFETPDKSNLKCALYGDVHGEEEKTNYGGQQSYLAPAPLIYIQQSSGFVLDGGAVDPQPETPEGYALVFESDKATEAPAYMEFFLLDKYDVDTCARECNQHAPDSIGGVCQFFNIWRAVIDGVPVTYVCVLFSLPTDEATAIYPGEDDVQVTLSRGYMRQNLVIDGGFEAYDGCLDFCYEEAYEHWIGTSPAGGKDDATIFRAAMYARTAQTVGLLGSATGADSFAGTLTPANTLTTIEGRVYKVALFQNSAYSGPTFQKDSFLEILWNGEVVKTVRPGYSDWAFVEAEVVAEGDDVVEIRGGKAPAWTFVDDIGVWLL
ncbi:hypothetical protein FA15DRAFT_689757 [Coprinopsis marcescibilis]|uniref:Fruit-body specific protein a n=1 Tax=Coprinopsis marcescibilis TaxID=230819 RepID=A0A5C3KFM1_COPMA|nr:hypothetical protein FA15DRAFT_689757 [Coprinopsis marcescibilis]